MRYLPKQSITWDQVFWDDDSFYCSRFKFLCTLYPMFWCSLWLETSQLIVWERYFAKFSTNFKQIEIVLLVRFKFGTCAKIIKQMSFEFGINMIIWWDLILEPLTRFRRIIPSSWFSVWKSLRHRRNRLSWLNFQDIKSSGTNISMTGYCLIIKLWKLDADVFSFSKKHCG